MCETFFVQWVASIKLKFTYDSGCWIPVTSFASDDESHVVEYKNLNRVALQVECEFSLAVGVMCALTGFLRAALGLPLQFRARVIANKRDSTATLMLCLVAKTTVNVGCDLSDEHVATS